MSCRSERASHQFTETLAAASAQDQFRTVVENHTVFIVKPGLQFMNSVYVYDCRAVNARELPGIELCLYRADSFAKQIRLLSDVKPYILPFGFDPVDLIGLQKERATARLYDDAIGMAGLRLQLLQ